MKWFLFVLSLVWIFCGVALFATAETIFHELAAGMFLLIGHVCMCSGAVIHAIRRVRQ